MIGFLASRFIKDYQNTSDAAVRRAYGVLCGAVGIAINLLLFALKLFAGTLAGSVAITADAFNNLSDASSNIVSLLGFRLASRPADEGHPYGHGRYEYLAGLFVAVLVCAVGINLVLESVTKIIKPSPTAYTLVSLAALATSMLAKLWMAAFNRTLGDRIDSETLIATAQDSKNDVITSGSVLVAALISQTTGFDLDGWAGLGVGIFICISGMGLVRDAISPLLGQAPDPKLVQAIRDKIMSYPQVLGTHDLMVHDYGPGHQFASLHIEFPAETDPLKAHDVIDNIENDFIKRDGLQVTIHYDPIVTTDAAGGVLRTRLMEKARQLDPCLSIHDLRIVPGDTHTNVLFDLEFPAGYTGNKDEMLAAMCQFVHEQDPKYSCVVKVEQSYASAAHEK